MADAPIGVTFMPTADQAAMGPRQGNLEGDLSQAVKILSLRLPRFLGARAPASPELLNGPGSSGLPPGSNPYAAAVIQALLAASGMGGGLAGGMRAPTPDFQYGNPPPSGPPSAGGTDIGGTLPPEPAPGGFTPGGYDSGSRPSAPPLTRDWLAQRRQSY